jgi:outer membrane protein TolC
VQAGHTGNPSCLIGCTALGPDFKQPEAEVEQQWLESDDSAIQTGDTGTSDWWAVFKNPVLNTLIQQAYEQNLPLQMAGLRIMQARAQLGIAIGSRYPQVQEAAGSPGRVGLSENQPNFNPALDDSFWTANAGFNASREPDFWGKFRRGVEDSLAGFIGAKAATGYPGDSVKSEKRAVELSLIQYREGAVDYQRVLDSQQTLLEQQDLYTNAQGNVVLSLVATYKALGAGWHIRAGQEFVPEARLKRMQERTDWGELITGKALPESLPEPPATGMEQPLFDKPV